MIVGDMADGRLILSIHEHWYRFLMGKEGFFQLGFYYPAENILGYSDTFLLGGIVHSIFRFAGFDLFLSFQFTQILTCIAGFYGLLYWLNQYRKIWFPFALFASFLFIIASPVFMGSRISHIQNQAVWLIPWIFVFLEQAWQDLHSVQRKPVWSFLGLSFFYGALVYSTFYTAWFFLLFAIIWVIAYIFISGFRPIIDFAVNIKKSWRYLLPGIFILGAWGSLFLFTYLPVRGEQVGRSFATVLWKMPDISSLVNRSETNLLWGQMATILDKILTPVPFHGEIGISIFLLIGIGYLTYELFRDHLFGGLDRGVEKATALAILVSFILMLKVGSFSLWIIPYKILPGSEAVRVVQRYEIFLLVPVLFLLSWGMEKIGKNMRGSSGIAFYCLIGGLLIAEQINLTENTGIDRIEQLQFLKTQPPPPEDALAFQVYGNYRIESERASIHHAGMLLSQYWDLPTVSGRSGFPPRDWTLREPSKPEGYFNLIRWGNLTGLEGKVYLYDLDKKNWDGFVQFPTIVNPMTLPQENLLDPEWFAKIAREGWNVIEPSVVWNNGVRSILIFPPLIADQGTPSLKLGLKAFLYKEHNEQSLVILLNGENVYENSFTFATSEDWLVLDIPDGAVKYGFTLEFSAMNAISPASLSWHDDHRQLGVGLTHLSIRDHSSKGRPMELPQSNLLDPVLFASIARAGWSVPEPFGIWNDGIHSTLEFPPLIVKQGSPTLKIGLKAFLYKEHNEQPLVVFLNGAKVYEKTLTKDSSEEIISLELPDKAVREGFTLRFMAKKAVSPESLSLGDDSRRLGVGLTHLSIQD